MNVDPAAAVSPAIVKQLVAAAPVIAQVVAYEDGLAVLLQFPAAEKVLGAARGGVRIFHSLDGVASSLMGYGITRFECNIKGWVPNPVARAKGSRERNETSD